MRWLGIGAAILACAVVLQVGRRWFSGEIEAPVAPAPVSVPPVADEPARLTAEARAAGVTLPPELTQRYPPGTTVHLARPIEPRQFAAGVGCPGGGFLPLLNGVPFAQPLHRNVDRDGPVPPVVAKRTDRDGDEWWVHADGSETTTRWMTKQVVGVAQRDVRTEHVVPARAEHQLPPHAAGPR